MMRRNASCWCWILLGAFVCGTSPPTVAAQSRPKGKLSALQTRHTEKHELYKTKLQSLLETCRANQIPNGEEDVRKYLATPRGTVIQMAVLSDQFEPEIPANLSPQERQFQVELRKARKDYAFDLYGISRGALRDGYPGFAFDLVREIVSHDPDHKLARQLLGFVEHEKRWVSPQARNLLQRGFVWHDDFGWIPEKNKERYVKGERLVDGRWMSKEKEAEIRRDFQKAWEVRTDHYLIRTNHSLDRGVQLGKALEDFHEFFHQTFAAFFTSPEQLRQLFDGPSKNNGRIPDPYNIHFYRERSEYLTRIKPHFPSIEATNGIYLPGGPDPRTAHFYYDPEGNHEATLYHEATHQLFYESFRLNRPIAEKGHFWVVEGIACYMESFQRQNGEFRVGDPQYIRFRGARHNFLNEKYYVPLQQFADMGMGKFQSAPMLAKNYTQASGLAHFFMHYDGGRYRDALVTHLSQLYSDNARTREHPQELDVLSGESFNDLDRLYGEYLAELAKKLAAVAETSTP